MKTYKYLLIVSLAFNIFIVIYFIRNNKNSSKGQTKETGVTNVINDVRISNFSIEKDFKKIFIDKNDSLYKKIYGISFENNPVQAYLLSCTYYMIKKDPSIKKDIQMISSELKAIYGVVPDIPSCP